MFRKTIIFALLIALLSPICSADEPAAYYVTDRDCEHPFIDVLDHWAQEEVCFLYQQGVIEGHSERNYFPNNQITRAEFLKIALLNLGYVVYPVQSSQFTDTNPGDWHYQYITFARSKGFVEGYQDGSFHPNDPINRAEAVMMIMRIAGIIDYDIFSTTQSFSDVSEDDWFAYAIAAANEHEIVEGYYDGTFRPYNPITRAESAAIAERVWGILYD